MVLVSLSHSTKLLTDFKINPYQSAYYDIVIQVDTYIATEREYYEILYSFSFHPPDYPQTDEELEALKVELHPFFYESSEASADIRLNQYLGIMLKNTFTAQLIEYLLMDNETLAQFSGRMSPEEYRNSLMWTISYFAKEVKQLNTKECIKN